MRTVRLLQGLAVAPLLLAITASEAQATSISGYVEFMGSAMWTLNGVNSTAALADGIKFAAVIDVTEAASTGDYAGLQPTTKADFTDLEGANEVGAPNTVGPLSVPNFWMFTDTGGTGLSYSLAISSLTSNVATGSGGSMVRSLVGAGIASISGFDNTSVTWNLTTVGNSSTLSFLSSAVSSAAVPDGGTTLSMLGLALLGIGALRRRLVR
uniref:2-deoxy-D-gluconate-3-dehydrogenase n=1 Tax=uncultured bacterium 'To-T 020 P12' TaxID=1263626 RepID=K9NBW7_9BACT|nr:2-deoxy-D-gluconate-3-dehydrogenase [uncultured bacterium 'To-T 020 P12']